MDISTGDNDRSGEASSAPPPADGSIDKLAGTEVGKLLWEMGFPAAAALLSAALYNMVDTFWVTRLGPAAVAGVTIVFPFQLLVTAAGSGTGIGIASLLSRLLGRSDEDAALKLSGHLVPLALLLSLLFVPLPLICTVRLVHLLGADGQTSLPASAYLFFVALGVPFLLFSQLSSNLFRGSGDTVTPMYAMVGSALLNLVLDPLFIFGLGPIPALGVTGAAAATCLSQLSSAFFLGLNLERGAWALGRRPPLYCFSYALLKEIYIVGTPAAFSSVILTLVVAFHNNVLAPFGAVAVGTYGILFRLFCLVFMPCFGICQALLPIVGFAYGAQDRNRLRLAVSTGIRASLSLCAAAALPALVFARPIILSFGGGTALEACATPALRICAPAWILAGPQLIWITCFQAVGRAGTALCLLLLKVFLFLVPLVLLGAHIAGSTGVWLAQPAAELLGFISCLVFARKVFA